MATTKEYVDIYKAFTFVGTEAEFGTGLTLTAKWSEARRGDPTTVPAIGSLEKSVTGSGSAYTITFTPAELSADLASYVGKTVYLHLYDDAGWRGTLAKSVIDSDEDTEDPLY